MTGILLSVFFIACDDSSEDNTHNEISEQSRSIGIGNQNSSNLDSMNFNVKEKKLYDLIMVYRNENNLPSVPPSKSLTLVAQSHAKDLENNNPNQGNCNMHSWSDQGNWAACCYTDDHAKADCMWDKPREMTSYSGNGYEISYMSSDSIKPESALNEWKKSSGHNSVVLNQEIWKDLSWSAIGVGVFGHYAVVWFGQEKDES